MSKLTKDKALEKIQGLSDGAEVILRTPEEETSFLNNYKDAEIEKEMKPKVGRIYDAIDADLFEVSGIRKDDKEKTYDYAKRVVSTFKSKAEKAADVKKYEDEIERLKKEGPSGEILKELETVRTQSAKAKTDYDAALADMRSKLANKDIEIVINDAMRGMKFVQGIPKNVMDTYLATTKSELIAGAKIIENKVVFVDKDGNTLIDQATYQPKTAAQMLAEKLSDVLDVGHTGAGTGSTDPKFGTDEKGNKFPIISVPATVKSKRDLVKHLNTLGFAANTPEFDAAYAKYGEKLPL